MESAKRRAPTARPVVHQGLRYEQLRRQSEQGFSQSGGVLAATDVASGKQLWVTQLFKRPSSTRKRRKTRRRCMSASSFLMPRPAC